MDDLQALQLLHDLALCSGDSNALVPTLLNKICDTAMAVAGADFGKLQLLDADTSNLKTVATRGFPSWWTQAPDAAGHAQGVARLAIERRARIVVEDVETSRLLDGTPALAMQRRAGIRALQATPLLNRAGHPLGVLSLCFNRPCRPDDHVQRWLDLLARQAADLVENGNLARALRESEARFRTLGMASADAVCRLSADGKRARFLDKQGVFPESDEGEDWMSRWIDAEDRVWLMQVLEDSRRGKTAIDVEYRVHGCKEQVKWVHSRAVPVLDAQGDVVEWFSTVSDVTDSRRAAARLMEEQRRLQTLLEALPVGVAFSSSRDCAHITGNAALLRQLGAGALDNPSANASDSSAYGRRVEYLRDGMLLSAHELPMQTAAREGRPVGPVELMARWPTGKEVWLEVFGAPICNAAGEITGAVAVSVDITERKRAAETREKMRLTDEFLAALGHELRNPLATLSSAIEWMTRETSRVDRPAMEDLIGRQLEVLKRLVDDLLDMSRMALETSRLRREPVSLKDLLRTAAAAAMPAIEARGQHLSTSLPLEDVSFSADPVRLQQVLSNLLDNACKYTPEGGTIELAGGIEGGHVVMRCRDSGPGIAPDMRSRIFEPMVRSESARRDVPQGLGLGLALVRKFAELHGGSVSVASTPSGEGSEFTVRLPMVPAGQAREPEPTPADDLARQSLMVALVEDDPDVARILAMAMERAGHRVVRFTDGPPAPDGNENGPPQSDGLLKAVELQVIVKLLLAQGKQPHLVRALLVQSRSDHARSMADLLRCEGFQVEVTSSGAAALDKAGQMEPDVLVCDMQLDDMPGLALIDQLRDDLAAWGSFVVVVTATAGRAVEFGLQAGSGEHSFVTTPINAVWIRGLLSRLSIRGGER